MKGLMNVLEWFDELLVRLQPSHICSDYRGNASSVPAACTATHASRGLGLDCEWNGDDDHK